MEPVENESKPIDLHWFLYGRMVQLVEYNLFLIKRTCFKTVDIKIIINFISNNPNTLLNAGFSV